MRTDKVILIAGGAGSIGSALAECLARGGAEDLILLDRDENSLEQTRQKLEEQGYTSVQPLVCDLRNLVHVNRIFSHFQPDLIFNCAASKHVVSGQRNISETTHNNLTTLLSILKARHCGRGSRLVHISTDKSVEPVSVMGASKMLCESMVRTEYPQTQDRNYIIRFGNVMNTNGSVLQIWDRQFREGRPLTVTDLKMKRWMLPISDACDQILRVLGFDAGSYVLDMGEMLSVGDILEKFLSERNIKDYPTRFLGAKSGEKSEEKLFWECEERKTFKAGARQIIRVDNSPTFNYSRPLNVSSLFDDQQTLDCLTKIFEGLRA